MPAAGRSGKPFQAICGRGGSLGITGFTWLHTSCLLLQSRQPALSWAEVRMRTAISRQNTLTQIGFNMRLLAGKCLSKVYCVMDKPHAPYERAKHSYRHER